MEPVVERMGGEFEKSERERGKGNGKGRNESCESS